MAEVVASLGLAANVIQFIQFSSKLSTTFWNFYRSNHATFDIVPDIKSLTTDLKDILDSLIPPGVQLARSQEGLLLLVSECQEVANQLHLLLLSLVPNASKSGKSAAIKSAWKLVWKEDDITQLQQRLDHFRAQLSIHMISTLRVESQKTRSQQEQMLEKLDILLETAQNKVREPIQFQLERKGFGSLLIQLLVAKSISVDAHISESTELEGNWREQLRQRIDHAHELQAVPIAFPTLSRSSSKQLEKTFLSLLYSPGMNDRENRIAEAHATTFRWIFEDSKDEVRKWSNLRKWLESDEKLYWITGKPGSGKSTLMKFLNQPHEKPRYKRYLSTWAAEARLVVASFYFWNSGLEAQMTKEGLLTSLLRQLLAKVPTMIPLVSPARWETLCLFHDAGTGSFSVTEMESMLRAFIQNLPPDTKVCLLIDGLDEFDGDHKKLAAFLMDLLESSNIKMCLASRPWTVFEDVFHRAPSLMLQDLTYNDIKSFTISALVSDSTFSLLQEREADYANELVEDIIRKASGVFLWVDLVVQSLLAGISKGDRVIDLQRRLELLPADLEQLYDKILQSLDPFYLEHAAQLFQLVDAYPVPPSLVALSLADEESRYAIKRDIKPWMESEAHIRYDTMRRRLNSRTKGFLEAPKYTLEQKEEFDPFSASVQYLHRTVRDYIKSEAVQKVLNSAIKSPFNPHVRWCSVELFWLKTLRPQLLDSIAQLNLLDSVNDREFSPFWNHIFRFLTQARLAATTNPGSGSIIVSLMDDLNTTCSKLAVVSQDQGSQVNQSVVDPDAHWRQNFLKEGLWVYVLPRDNDLPFGGHFLSLAVRHGITPYVKAKAKPGCFIPKLTYPLLDSNHALPAKAGLYSLLTDALAVPDVPDGRQKDKWLYGSPAPDMILCLVEMGADFNWKPPSILIDRFDTNHPWYLLFKNCQDHKQLGQQICFNTEHRQTWTQILHIVFLRGQKPSRLIIDFFVARQSQSSLSKETRSLLDLMLEVMDKTGVARGLATSIRKALPGSPKKTWFSWTKK